MRSSFLCLQKKPLVYSDQKVKPGWLARLPSFSPVQIRFCSKPRCGITSPAPHAYITIARFSNSYWSTGMAHPAISTRPAASSAALGDTP